MVLRFMLFVVEILLILRVFSGHTPPITMQPITYKIRAYIFSLLVHSGKIAGFISYRCACFVFM